MKVDVDTHQYREDNIRIKSLVNICISDIEDGLPAYVINDAADSAVGVFERVLLSWKRENAKSLAEAEAELEEKKGDSA